MNSRLMRKISTTLDRINFPLSKHSGTFSFYI